jgi:hypothetical protein
VYSELGYLYLHLHTIIQPKLYYSQTNVSGFLKNKVKKIYKKIVFFPYFEFTYVLLITGTGTFLPTDTDFKIITLSYLLLYEI